MDELEGDFGTGGQVERVQFLGVGGMDDAVEAGAEERGSGTKEASSATPWVAPPWRMMLRVR